MIHSSSEIPSTREFMALKGRKSAELTEDVGEVL